MKILAVHEYYRERGGEDETFEREVALLERFGHDVVGHTVHNDAVDERRPLRLARDTIWNRRARREIRALVQDVQPDVAHFHNTFPLLSPAALRGARDADVPVVMTLHNYRLVCPNALLFRDGRPCEDCVGKRVAWPGVLHACYRSSRRASAVTAAMTAVHRSAGTWQETVNRFVALSGFARDRLVAGGLDPAHITVKPNFVDPDPGPGSGRGDYAIYVGRLSPEKGLSTVLAAWESMASRIPLKVVGDGPMAPSVRDAASRLPDVDWLGHRPVDEVLELIGDARCLIFPSVVYEAGPRTGIEAFAKGTPVVAADLGAIAELVDDGHTGACFAPGDPRALERAVEGLFALSDADVERMRRAARERFLAHHSGDANHAALLDIYRDVIEDRSAPDQARSDT